ncbi:GspH/FimT family protein [Thermus oshimai]|uniref:GspH/FimT family protein n=1 Tax=Thermus TaxID=270 RepID=UPI00309B1492
MRGFSLLELLLVLSILGIVLALGLPRLNPDAQAVNQAARGLAEQVVRARLEAIRQNAPAGLAVFTEGAGGYAVFLDQNENRAYDPGEEIQAVRFGEGPWARVRLLEEASALGNLPLLFDARGVPAKPIAATIALADPGRRQVRKVVVSQAGRARLE